MLALNLSQCFPSNRKSLLFHVDEIEMEAGIASQIACPVFISFLIMLKHVHINAMFSYLLDLHIVSSHIKIVEFCVFL